MRVCRRLGIPTRRPIEIAATASGGATIAPSVRAAAHGRPGTTACATAPTTRQVKTTSPTESSAIGRALARKSSRLASSDAL